MKPRRHHAFSRWAALSLVCVALLRTASADPAETDAAEPRLQPVILRFPEDRPAPPPHPLVPVHMHAPPALPSAAEPQVDDPKPLVGQGRHPDAPEDWAVAAPLQAPAAPAASREGGWLADRTASSAGRDSAAEALTRTRDRQGWLSGAVNRMQSQQNSSIQKTDLSASPWDALTDNDLDREESDPWSTRMGGDASSRWLPNTGGRAAERDPSSAGLPPELDVRSGAGGLFGPVEPHTADAPLGPANDER